MKYIIPILIVGLFLISGCSSEKSISSEECEARGGDILEADDWNNPTCPEGRENLGELNDIDCICVCCKYPDLGNIPQITESDLTCGTYYGTYDQKKPGTPDDWIHIEAGKSSRWSAPNVTILPMDCVENQHDPGITILE